MIDIGFVLVQLEAAFDSSTDITSPTIAFFIASSRPAVIFDEVQGSFGASQLSNFALSASRCRRLRYRIRCRTCRFRSVA